MPTDQTLILPERVDPDNLELVPTTENAVRSYTGNRLVLCTSSTFLFEDLLG